MSLLARIRAAFRNLFYKRRVEDRLDAEVRSYTDMLAEEKIAAGMSPAEARRQALAESGGVEQIKQAVRDRRAGVAFEVFAPCASCAAVQALPRLPSSPWRWESAPTLPFSVL
jgi:hypothetical protein